MDLCLTPEAFAVIFSRILDKIEEYGLEELRTPRIRGPPARYYSGKISHIPSSPEEYFKSVYYEFVESVKFTVSERYDRQATGYRQYLKLESMLINGKLILISLIDILNFKMIV